MQEYIEHKNKKKEHGMVVFSFPPYTPEHNKIESTFGRLKNKISFKNLNSKEFRE